MYILLTSEDTVAEIIPDINPIFPGVPIENRYAPDFIKKLIYISDDTEVEQNWIYDKEKNAFTNPTVLNKEELNETTKIEGEA